MMSFSTKKIKFSLIVCYWSLSLSKWQSHTNSQDKLGPLRPKCITYDLYELVRTNSSNGCLKPRWKKSIAAETICNLTTVLALTVPKHIRRQQIGAGMATDYVLKHPISTVHLKLAADTAWKHLIPRGDAKRTSWDIQLYAPIIILATSGCTWHYWARMSPIIPIISYNVICQFENPYLWS